MLKFTRFKGSSAVRALAIAGAVLAPVASLGGQVTLKSIDGTVDLVGELLSFENNMYVVETIVGSMTVSADSVTCIGADCPTFDTIPVDFVLAGSDTVGLGLMPLLLEGWAASMDAAATITNTPGAPAIVASLVGDQGFGEPLNAVQVSSTTSSDAFRTLLAGTADLGMASRPIRPSEAEALGAIGAGNMFDPAQEHIIAVDSLVIVVHPDNPVQELSIDQVAGIYSGRIRNWAQLGGRDARINVHDYRDGSGTRSVFMNAVFGNTQNPVSGAQIQPTNQEMSDSINEDVNAIGYVGYAFQRGAKALPLVNECGITMTPDSFSVRTEEYSIQRRLYLYNTQNGLSADAENFVQYAQSSDADEMIEKSGFISLGIDSRPQTSDSPRAQTLLQPVSGPLESRKMGEMLNVMDDFDRLSSTFRFQSGSAQLDVRAPLDMARLAEYLRDVPNGTDVLFVGFTDSVGEFQSNQRLSERRAEQVMETFSNVAGSELPGIQMEAIGFGEITPSACNISEAGREINRRVEVWISASNDS